jgi:hypothetical protein
MASRKRKPTGKRRPIQHAVAAVLRQPFDLTMEGYALRLVIRSDGRKLGTLGIGRGSIAWKGRRDQRALPLGWRQFVLLMERERENRKSRR